MRYLLCLGSNLGPKRKNLARARRLLGEKGVVVLRGSSLYRTQPVGRAGQPWFVNQVLRVESDRAPGDLLRLVKRIEREMRRAPGPRFGPRVIDIDILLAGRRVVDAPRLRVPHPRLAQRRFVLAPLAEIAPRTVHPLLGKTAARLLRETPDRSRVALIHGG
jgi:2-amino-4-hydroxy-6-hydroxymethyldihydropteridine diphosphokinase